MAGIASARFMAGAVHPLAAAVRIPTRFAPLLFSALLSAVMVGIVSAFVLTISQGFSAGFPAQWLKSCITTWPVAWIPVRPSPAAAD